VRRGFSRTLAPGLTRMGHRGSDAFGGHVRRTPRVTFLTVFSSTPSAAPTPAVIPSFRICRASAAIRWYTNGSWVKTANATATSAAVRIGCCNRVHHCNEVEPSSKRRRWGYPPGTQPEMGPPDVGLLRAERDRAGEASQRERRLLVPAPRVARWPRDAILDPRARRWREGVVRRRHARYVGRERLHLFLGLPERVGEARRRAPRRAQ